MRRLLAVAAIAFLMVACIPFQQTSSNSSQSSSPTSPSPSGPLMRALWVLSPLGIRLRDQPSFNGKALATIPQGTQVTATGFNSGDVGWYQVTFQGQGGWIASKDNTSTPPQDLVTTHPRLSYSNPAAGYYFLYPASWQVSDRGVDVEVDEAGATPGPTPAAGAIQAGQAKMTVHQGPSIDKLAGIPTTPGSNLDQSDYEIGGITAVKHTYQLTGGGYEGDIKVLYSQDRALLVTFRGAAQSDLDAWVEMVESFGFSVPPPGAPKASPSH